MFRILGLVLTLALVGVISFNTPTVEAKKSSGGSYYKSAKTGKFIPKSFYKSHPSTTYRGRR